jgi:bacterial/archaeal transporter family-2 protein
MFLHAMYVLYIFLCFIAGLSIAIQAAVNASLGKTTKLPSFATLMSFLLGLVPIFIYYIIETKAFKLGTYGGLHWWQLIGGFLGAFYVFVIIYTTSKLGATVALSATIVGQVILGLVLDSYGLLDVPKIPLSKWRLVGTSLIITGAVIASIK